jgi:hypothetical protein
MARVTSEKTARDHKNADNRKQEPRAGETTRGQEARHAGRSRARLLRKLKKSPHLMRSGAGPPGAPLQLAGCATILHAAMLSITMK